MSDKIVAQPVLGEGVATFGLALPKGTALSVQIADLLTQVDVKRRWEDGSICHAIVHSRIPNESQYPIRAVDPVFSLPPAIAAWPVVTTELLVKSTSADGTVSTTKYTAPLPTSALFWTSDLWFSGPVVSEGRALVPFKAGTVEHPFLRVRYDRRQCFPNGRRLSVTFESIVDVPEMNVVTYDASIKVGTSVVFSRGAISHHSFSRWRPVPILLDGLQVAKVVPDLEPFYQSRALIRPQSEFVLDRVPTMDPVKFDILNIGDLQPVESAPGGRPEIGPYPAWVNWYLANKRPEQLEYLLRMGENVSGAWSMHISHLDDRPVTLDNVPDANTWTWGGGTGPKNKKVGRKFGPEIGSAHRPSLAFVPYVLTGDRFYLDEMRAWTHYAFMGWGPFGRRATEGIIVYQQTRGVGWSTRDVADFLGFAPDTDPDRPYFLEKFKNNLRELDIKAAAGKDPLGSLFPTGSYISKDAATIQSQVPMWQNDYLTWGLHHALKNRGLGPEGWSMLRKLIGYRMAMATTQGFSRKDLTEYWYYVTRHEAGNPPHADFGAMYQYNYVEIDPVTNKTRKPPSASILPGYAGELRMSAIVAMDLGFPGSKELYDEIQAAKYVAPNVNPNWGMKEYFAGTAGGVPVYQSFAVAPYPVEAPVPTPSGWQVVEQEDNKLILEKKAE